MNVGASGGSVGSGSLVFDDTKVVLTGPWVSFQERVIRQEQG